MRLFVLVVLVLGCVCAAADTVVLAARRYETDDGWVAALVYAGHVHHPLGLWVRWPTDGPPRTNGGAWNDSEVLLAPADKLVAAIAPGTASPLDDPWLPLLARHERHMYRLGVLQPPASVLPSEAASGQARGLLNLAWPNSTLWARIATAAYTGSRLLLSPRASDTDEGRGVVAGTRRLVLPLAGATASVGGTRVSNVTLVWDPAAALTWVPPALMAEARRRSDRGDAWELTVVLPDGAGTLVLADAADLEPRDAPRLAAAAGAAEEEVRIGRRLAVARGLAVAFAAQRPASVAAGAAAAALPAGPPVAITYTVWWATALPAAVRDVAAVGGLVVLFMLGYAAAHLLPHLRLAAVPSLWQAAPAGTGAEGRRQLPVEWRVLRHAWILLVLGTALHVLALFFAGRGAVVDASLGAPLAALAVALGTGSLPLALLLGVAAVRALRSGHLPAHGSWPGAAFVGAHAVLLARSLAAALLVGGGVTMVGVVTLAVVWLGMVLFTNAYAALLLLVTVLARPRAPGRPWGRRLLGYAQVLVHLALVALDLAAGALWLLAPALDATNRLYAPRVLDGAVVWLLVTPALVATVLVARETSASAAH